MNQVTALIFRRIIRFKIDCRSVEISQVLLNLLNNAFDAVSTTEASRKKWVQVGITETKHFVQISVTDNGTGISPAIRDKIMQPFFTTKEIGAGTGLGLSISKEIIEAHHGELFLDSTTDCTRFVISLPKSSGNKELRNTG